MPLEYWILFGWAFVLIWVPFVITTNRKEQPAVLFWLFMVELWERFSYYGMRAFLVLYLTITLVTGGFGFDKKVAYSIYAAYGALVYLTPLAGGFLADKVLGFRRAIIWGALLMAAGQFTLAMSPGTGLMSKAQYEAREQKWAEERGHENAMRGMTPAQKKEYLDKETQLLKQEIVAGKKTQPGQSILLYVGLSLLVTGNGFFKPNISSMIGRFYPQGDPRRDRAFTIFYMGINTGAFIAPLTCGYVAETQGWRYGFMLAGTGMLTGLLTFLYTASRGYLQDHGDPPADAPKTVRGLPTLPTVLLGSLLFVPVSAYLISTNHVELVSLQLGKQALKLSVMDLLLMPLGMSAILFMFFMSFRYAVAERQRIWVIVILLFFTAVFWSFFELAGSALNVFTDENVDKRVFGSEIPASVFQAVNALFIVLFAPLFSFMWGWLYRRGIEPAAPFKFSIGLLLLGVGFLILDAGRGVAVDGVMPLIFLIIMYLFHTLGELSLSPVGLSLVTKLAPARIVGFMMGFWFLSSAIGIQAGKWIGGESAAPEGSSRAQTMNQALDVFNNVGLFAIGSGVLLLILAPILRKWMHGIR